MRCAPIDAQRVRRGVCASRRGKAQPDDAPRFEARLHLPTTDYIIDVRSSSIFALIAAACSGANTSRNETVLSFVAVRVDRWRANRLAQRLKQKPAQIFPRAADCHYAQDAHARDAPRFTRNNK